MAMIDEERQEEADLANKAKAATEKALDNCRQQLQNLTRLCYRGLISEQEFATERAELVVEEKALCERLENFTEEGWLQPARKLVLFSNRAKFWLLHGNIDEKRLILQTVGSNPTQVASCTADRISMPNRVCIGLVASKAATMVTMPTQRAIGSGPSKGICSQNESLDSLRQQ
jgi:hypothetical protein